MNFLAHAAVAHRARPVPPFVLGAVLPDLAAMAGLRLDRASVTDDVARGWRHHHRTDAAFHEHPSFLAGVRALRADLPLPRGPRRAAAHVGWELLLDDALAGDVEVIDAFRAALDVGRTVSDDVRWHGLLDRLALIRPDRHAPADVLALRVQRACARRPRLAVDDEHLDALAHALDAHRPAVHALAEPLVDQLGGQTGAVDHGWAASS